MKAVCDIYAYDYLCFDYELPEPCGRIVTLREKRQVVDKVRKKEALAYKP